MRPPCSWRVWRRGVMGIAAGVYTLFVLGKSILLGNRTRRLAARCQLSIA